MMQYATHMRQEIKLPGVEMIFLHVEKGQLVFCPVNRDTTTTSHFGKIMDYPDN